MRTSHALAKVRDWEGANNQTWCGKFVIPEKVSDSPTCITCRKNLSRRKEVRPDD